MCGPRHDDYLFVFVWLSKPSNLPYKVVHPPVNRANASSFGVPPTALQLRVLGLFKVRVLSNVQFPDEIIETTCSTSTSAACGLVRQLVLHPRDSWSPLRERETYVYVRQHHLRKHSPLGVRQFEWHGFKEATLLRPRVVS